MRQQKKSPTTDRKKWSRKSQGHMYSLSWGTGTLVLIPQTKKPDKPEGNMALDKNETTVLVSSTSQAKKTPS